VGTVSVNWTVVFNRLFTIIDTPRPSPYYYSGPKFIDKVQEVNEEFPNYGEFLQIRNNAGASTTRRDYYKDILIGLGEDQKRALVRNILDDLERLGHPSCTDIRGLISGTANAPFATIPADAWNSERLKNFLEDMDKALEEKKPERVLTLAYTCLEGFFKAYVRQNVPTDSEETEITALAK